MKKIGLTYKEIAAARKLEFQLLAVDARFHCCLNSLPKLKGSYNFIVHRNGKMPRAPGCK